MGISALKAEAAMLRDGNVDILTASAYSDVALQALYFTSAYRDLINDICEALDLEPSDTTSLDDIYTDHEARLERALAYKQLCYFYQTMSEGEGSKTWERWKLYRTLYEEERKNFSQLRKEYISRTAVIKIWR